LINVNGTLYGTTYAGGSANRGTVYSISTDGAENVLYSFAGGSADGSSPTARLTNVDGTFYGTTYDGGPSNAGTVYSIGASGAENVLYSFTGKPDGGNPDSDLIDANGTLYGTTSYGGSAGYGTVYTITTSGAEKVLYSFAGGTDGARPAAGLTDVRGTFYGTTSSGGGLKCPGGCGTVYSITSAGAEKVLYRFGAGAGGRNPEANLLNINGTLYGTTAYGGDFCSDNHVGCGTVFRISLTGNKKTIHLFTGGGADGDGKVPKSGLIDVRGTLYGTTFGGGDGACGYPDCGTLYSVTPAGSETVLHTFTRGSKDGAWPVASLIDVNGTLYGTAETGGQPYQNCHHGCGAVFTWSL
jgi:uncharacterized repeat protein (TIGR03803 family)